MWPVIIYLLTSLSAFWVSPLGNKWISISKANSLISLLFSFRKQNLWHRAIVVVESEGLHQGKCEHEPHDAVKIKESIHVEYSEESPAQAESYRYYLLPSWMGSALAPEQLTLQVLF